MFYKIKFFTHNGDEEKHIRTIQGKDIPVPRVNDSILLSPNMSGSLSDADLFIVRRVSMGYENYVENGSTFVAEVMLDYQDLTKEWWE